MPRPRTPKVETGARELAVEPGPPPTSPDERTQLRGDEPPEQYVPLVETVEQLVEWEREVVGDLLVLPFLPLWYAAHRGGAPPGAFIPDDVERDTMARPATRMLNRSERLRQYAKWGDPLSFAIAVSQFVRHEAEEIDEWRAGYAPQPVEPELAGMGVRAVDVDEPVRVVREPQMGGGDAPRIRPWRPPSAIAESIDES